MLYRYYCFNSHTCKPVKISISPDYKIPDSITSILPFDRLFQLRQEPIRRIPVTKQETYFAHIPLTAFKII